jgi:hypothetical protein
MLRPLANRDWIDRFVCNHDASSRWQIARMLPLVHPAVCTSLTAGRACSGTDFAGFTQVGDLDLHGFARADSSGIAP